MNNFFFEKGIYSDFGFQKHALKLRESTTAQLVTINILSWEVMPRTAVIAIVKYLKRYHVGFVMKQFSCPYQST